MRIQPEVRSEEIVIRPPADLLNYLTPQQTAALYLSLSGSLLGDKQRFLETLDQALADASRFVPDHLRAL